MSNWKIAVTVLLCVFLFESSVFSASSVSNGQVTEQLENGCNITRKVANSTKKKFTTWWDYMPLPHLNCSGTGQTRFNVEGVIEDTQSISLSYNNMIEFHIDDLSKFKKLKKLMIKSNQLKRLVPSENNLVLPVTSLTLTQNQLDSIPNLALKSFPNLTTLVINNNQISAIRDDDFRYNPKLNIISLGINPITSFQDAWMRTLNLTGINLRDCGLTEVPKPIASMQRLLYADLSENKITHLPAYLFANASVLYWLDLAANKITSINENALRGATRLTVVDLSDNLLLYIPANTFEGLTKENIQVDLYENPFICDCNMAPFRQWNDQMKIRDASTEIRYSCENPLRNHGKKSHQLTIDDFRCDPNDVMWTGDCGSPVTTTAPTPTTNDPVTRTCPSRCTCYDSNKQVYFSPPGQQASKQKTGWIWWKSIFYPRVDCDDTNFNNIPLQIPEDVQTIIFSGNRFTTFYIQQLRKFKKLKSLIIKDNNIRQIAADINTVLPSLTVLRMSFNNITSIGKSHLKSFPNLEIFSIFHNKLNSVPEDLFAYNSKINRIYLGPNPVKNFDEDFMKTLNLRSLSLRNLSLTAVPKSLSNLDKLGYLDISDNKITTLKNNTFSKCTSLVRLAMDNNLISKIESNAFNGATSLISLDLSENKLNQLPATVFSNLSQERLTVELWENPFVCDCKMKGFKSWVEKREGDDPMTEIRFVCKQPLRMHNKKSDQLTADDFMCSTDDVIYTDSAVCKAPNIGGRIAVAVVVTFLCTSLLGFIIWRCTFKRRYGHLLNYAKQRHNYDDDMEELQ